MLSGEMQQWAPAEASTIGQLYERHAPGAVRLAYLLTGDRASAEDLAQDAFVKVAGRLVHLRDPGAFDAYLRRTVVNLSHSNLRRKRVERLYLLKHRSAAGQAAAETGSFEDREELWSALLRLPERQRAAIVLRFYEDLSEAQTAEILR